MVGALGYIVTQISKILLIAGLVNLSPFWEHIIDLMGMYYFLVHHQKASLASVKILSKLKDPGSKNLRLTLLLC